MASALCCGLTHPGFRSHLPMLSLCLHRFPPVQRHCFRWNCISRCRCFLDSWLHALQWIGTRYWVSMVCPEMSSKLTVVLFPISSHKKDGWKNGWKWMTVSIASPETVIEWMSAHENNTSRMPEFFQSPDKDPAPHMGDCGIVFFHWYQQNAKWLHSADTCRICAKVYWNVGSIGPLRHVMFMLLVFWIFCHELWN